MRRKEVMHDRQLIIFAPTNPFIHKDPLRTFN